MAKIIDRHLRITAYSHEPAVSNKHYSYNSYALFMSLNRFGYVVIAYPLEMGTLVSFPSL